MSKKSFNPKETWQQFYKKSYVPEDAKRLENFTKVLSAEEKIQFDKDLKGKTWPHYSAAKIQTLWKKFTSDNKLVKVSLKAYYPPEFLQLVNKQSVKKSVNRKKLDTLLSAINQGDVTHPIFNDSHIRELALSLFGSKKITQQQITTILTRTQSADDIIEIVPVLGEDNELSEKMCAILDELESAVNPSMSSKDMEKLASLILELPLSERFFFKVQGKLGPLGLALIRLKGLSLLNEGDGKSYIVHFSAGVQDALNIIRYGVSNCVRILPALGIKTPGEIEKALRESQTRLADVDFTEVKRSSRIHELPASGAEAFWHDIYHAMVLSAMPRKIQLAILEMAKIFREIVKIDILSIWCKEIWVFVDSEFTEFFLKWEDYQGLKKQDISTEVMTGLFLRLITVVNKDGAVVCITPHIDDKSETGRTISTFGVVFLLDFLKNPEKWKNFNIDLDSKYVIEEHKDLEGYKVLMNFYQSIKEIYPFIKDDSLKVQIFKCLLSQNKQGQDYAQAKLTDINDQLKFKKLDKESIKEWKLPDYSKNSVHLFFKDKRLSSESSIETLNLSK